MDWEIHPARSAQQCRNPAAVAAPMNHHDVTAHTAMMTHAGRSVTHPNHQGNHTLDIIAC